MMWARYGEMTIEEKDKISHRYRALAKLRVYLNTLEKDEQK